jgi:hypothetical protein
MDASWSDLLFSHKQKKSELTTMDSEHSRLQASARRIADLVQETRAERRRRDGLIRQLLDRGDKYKHVSKSANRSIGTCAAIAARRDDDGED